LSPKTRTQETTTDITQQADGSSRRPISPGFPSNTRSFHSLVPVVLIHFDNPLDGRHAGQIAETTRPAMRRFVASIELQPRWDARHQF
jgi:hypothetical protein